MNIGSIGKVAASLAAFTMVASPALAVVPASRSGHAVAPASLPGDVAQDRGWGRGGWGGGWNGGGWGGGRRHHDGVDAGDVLAGVFVFGTIAAIASAASKSSKDKREREERSRPYDNDGWRYGDEPRRDNGPADYGRTSSLDTAVDSCVGEVERGTNRVDTVDAVNRDGSGWRVEGRTRAGTPFNCSVDGDGRIKGFSVETAQLRN
ncbi:MAG: hypothetical protein ACKOPQ_03015 [Novosphingobium sp.]